ncbi:hypothetical protein SUGI_0596890 [Cryptomeria japonica]|nr:hypothetical protein SUGI_0596890 [Cryptomeria japonica]
MQAMAAEEDRLSDLADNLLSYEILSKLSLRDAVRSSILSTRWRPLWTKNPHLHFSKEFFDWICSETLTGKYTDIIDNILQQHFAPLTSFRFDPPYLCKSDTEKIEEWIECIRIKGVKEIGIKSHFIPMIHVPTTLFACQTLTALTLEYLSFRDIPKSCLGFPCLVSCSLHFIVADTENNIRENFIALCPQLQNLGLSECYGLNNFKVCAQHLKYLKLKYCSFQTLTVDCPQLMKLEVIGCKFGALERNDWSASSSFKLKCPTSLYDVNVSDFWLLESLSAAKTIRKISFGKCKLSCLSGFLNMLSNFPNLEKLTINECYVEEKNMAAGREIEIGSDMNFPNLKGVSVDILCTMTSNELAMLDFLVDNASSFKILTINLPSCCPEVRSQILDLKKASTEVEIRILDQKGSTDALQSQQRVKAGRLPLVFA